MKIRYFILLGFIILSSGCKDFLDTKPEDALFPGNYYQTRAPCNAGDFIFYNKR